VLLAFKGKSPCLATSLWRPHTSLATDDADKEVALGSASPLTTAEIAALGVLQVSVGGAISRSAWGGFATAFRTLIENGTFAGFANALTGGELNALFRS